MATSRKDGEEGTVKGARERCIVFVQLSSMAAVSLGSKFVMCVTIHPLTYTRDLFPYLCVPYDYAAPCPMTSLVLTFPYLYNSSHSHGLLSLTCTSI